jgi:hypothetical protein
VLQPVDCPRFVVHPSIDQGILKIALPVRMSAGGLCRELLASLAPDQPFLSSPLADLNSPVTATVNGKAAEVLGAVGNPGSVDGYQINFRLPPDITKGQASIQVTAARIEGAAVSISVQ